MREQAKISLTVNGVPMSVASGTTVAVAISMAGMTTRTSLVGELRAPVCGMGICFECRSTVNGVSQRRTCQMLCEPGMDVRTT